MGMKVGTFDNSQSEPGRLDNLVNFAKKFGHTISKVLTSKAVVRTAKAVGIVGLAAIAGVGGSILLAGALSTGGAIALGAVIAVGVGVGAWAIMDRVSTVSHKVFEKQPDTGVATADLPRPSSPKKKSKTQIDEPFNPKTQVQNTPSKPTQEIPNKAPTPKYKPFIGDRHDYYT